MGKKSIWGVLIVLAVINGIYPIIYMFQGKFGLLEFKTDALLANRLWQLGFYTHIVFGGIALLVGWAQFVSRWRDKYVKAHRAVGMVYIVSVLLASVSGIGIGFTATGGFIASAGFITLGVLWFYTTLTAFTTIKKYDIDRHETLMIYSYALCFAAATLRVYLPLSIASGIDFVSAYRVIAWMSWVPNLVVAFLIVRRIEAARRPQMDEAYAEARTQ